MNRLLALTLVLSAAHAAAEPVGVVTEPPRRPEPTDVEPAPAPLPPPVEPAARPDQVSGIAVEDEPRTSRLVWIPRALLFVPRMIFWGAVQPLRGATYVYEKYELQQRFFDATFTDDRRFGIYPVAGYQSSFGFTVGARLLYKDIFGERERIKLHADYGGEFLYAVGGTLTTGDRLGPVRLELESSIERRPRDHFYGIGNGNEIATPPVAPIDARMDDTAISSRFQQDVLRNVGTIRIKLGDWVKNRISGAWMQREFDRSPDTGSGTDKDITMRYDTSTLVGFESGVNSLYVENELSLDTRRPASRYGTQTLDSAGWLLRGYVGMARGLENDPTRYYAYGGELQRYIDLSADGEQILALRAMVDAVGGTDGRTDGRISFVDLPRLGGSEYLRGYSSGRFRDRAVVLGTAEYQWAVSPNAASFLFYDIGQPLASLAERPEGPIRMGFGVGLQFHTKNTFLARTQLAVSREGDIHFNLVFSPAFGRRERAGRY
jgi:hypothetical protein